MPLTASRTGTGETFRKIVESARSILAQEGYRELSMREVARRAGVTPGAIYRHFEDREELIDHVVRDSLARYELELTQSIASEPVGSFARVVAMGRKYIEFARVHSEEFKILFSTERGEPRKVSALPGKAGFDLLRGCVIDAMESGEMRRADPGLTAFFLWSRVHGIVTLLLACDFREELVGTDEELTPELAFSLTRSLALHGVAPVGAWG